MIHFILAMPTWFPLHNDRLLSLSSLLLDIAKYNNLPTFKSRFCLPSQTSISHHSSSQPNPMARLTHLALLPLAAVLAAAAPTPEPAPGAPTVGGPCGMNGPKNSMCKDPKFPICGFDYTVPSTMIGTAPASIWVCMDKKTADENRRRSLEMREVEAREAEDF